MVTQNFIDKFKPVVNESNDLKGTWQIVQWNPDIATREWHNIAVGFKYGDHQYQVFKWLDDFTKTEMLYGQKTANYLKELISFLQCCYGHNCYDISGQIRMIKVGFQRAESVEMALDRSYRRVITLA
ncbi:MAG: hypothetical protein [Bacteriophage sp.]|nr:MAG: hypothetical protein [Bacteriophage sp.]